MRNGSVSASGDVIGKTGFDTTDPEVQELFRRIRAGLCEVRYGGRPPGITRDQLAHEHWEVLAENQLEPIFGFYEHLTHYGAFVDATDRAPRRFQFPGIVEGASRRYYQRNDSPEAPDTNHAAETSLALLNWTPHIPYGGAYLHAVDVLDSPGSVSVSPPQRVYHRRKDQTAAIVALARAWRTYWRGLPSDFQNNSVRRTLRKHVEHAIGRMWADKPFDQEIRVFQGLSSRDIDARDAEDWMLGNMEFWVNDWGFEPLALALAELDRRSLLDTQLDDYTFCHINLDGSVGDRLSNGRDGITQATWDAYQDTHYPAAVRHGVQPMALPGGTVSVMQGETATLQLDLTGGLGPFSYELTVDEDWSTVDENGLVTLAPAADVPAGTHTLTATVTDDLDNTVSAQIVVTITVLTQITVNAGPDHTVPSRGTAAVTATMEVTDGVGNTDIEWVLIGGAGSTLLPADSLTPTFTAPPVNAGDPNHVITWELRVSNNGITGSDRVTFTVTPPE